MESLPYHITNERSLRAMTGVTPSIFFILLEVFSIHSHNAKEQRCKPLSLRKRAFGGGNKSKLCSPTHELIFILFYLKTYPTYDVLATRFGMSRGIAFKQVQEQLKQLRQSLIDLEVVPQRSFDSPQSFKDYCTKNNITEMLLDATERGHFKYKDKDLKNATYSGKKKILK